MKVLGIAHGHNATVSLVADGRVVFCQSEERLNRIKNSTGLPRETLRHVYEHWVRSEDIDLAVIFEQTIAGYLAEKQRGFAPVPGAYGLDRCDGKTTLRKFLLRTAPGRAMRRWRSERAIASAAARREAAAYYANALQLPANRIKYLEHHIAHAYSVIPNIAQWGDALIFTLDGFGDGLCATVSRFENGRIERLSASGESHSLGTLYWNSTLLLGMKGLEDEYKLMALAAYTEPGHYADLLARLRGFISVDESGAWKCSVGPDSLLEELGAAFRAHRFDRIAGAVQALAEERIMEWISYWVAKTGCRNVAMSGGVFMNVKANHRVAGLPCVDRLFVMPSAGDESCAIGSAVWGSLQLSPTMPIEPLAHLYLGMDFADAEIERCLAAAGSGARHKVTRPHDLAAEIAKLLAANKVVARFAGRMEFGARALGNRSILAHPGDARTVRRLNSAIKKRDFWMPFAPSILDEDMGRYVREHDKAPCDYMCLARDSTALAQRELAAALHPADLTLRPQAVREEWNPGFYAILKAFRANTGIGGVINTSFNLHGEPIVCTPSDAIDAFERSQLDALAIGPYLVERTLDSDRERRVASQLSARIS